MSRILQASSRLLAPLFFCIVVSSQLGLAQETRGSILGSVKDPSGGVVPGVEVAVTNLDINVTTRTLTNDSGLFEVPLLMSGQYEISAELQGFKKYIRRGITLNVGSRVNIEIQLEIGQMTEAVTVTADEPLLETTTASTG